MQYEIKTNNQTKLNNKPKHTHTNKKTKQNKQTNTYYVNSVGNESYQANYSKTYHTCVNLHQSCRRSHPHHHRARPSAYTACCCKQTRLSGKPTTLQTKGFDLRQRPYFNTTMSVKIDRDEQIAMLQTVYKLCCVLVFAILSAFDSFNIIFHAMFILFKIYNNSHFKRTEICAHTAFNKSNGTLL